MVKGDKRFFKLKTKITEEFMLKGPALPSKQDQLYIQRQIPAQSICLFTKWWEIKTSISFDQFDLQNQKRA